MNDEKLQISLVECSIQPLEMTSMKSRYSNYQSRESRQNEAAFLHRVISVTELKAPYTGRMRLPSIAIVCNSQSDLSSSDEHHDIAYTFGESITAGTIVTLQYRLVNKKRSTTQHKCEKHLTRCTKIKVKKTYFAEFTRICPNKRCDFLPHFN